MIFCYKKKQQKKLELVTKPATDPTVEAATGILIPVEVTVMAVMAG